MNHYHRLISAAPTVDTAIYASGDLLGTKMTFEVPLTGVVRSAIIADESVQAADIELVLFDSNPSGTTFTDNAAFDIADADLFRIFASILFGSTHRFAYADNGMKIRESLYFPYQAERGPTSGNGKIYGALVSRGTPTFAAATDVLVRLGIVSE